MHENKQGLIRYIFHGVRDPSKSVCDVDEGKTRGNSKFQFVDAIMPLDRF